MVASRTSQLGFCRGRFTFGSETSSSGAKFRRIECLAIIERAQTQDGGWGPYVDSPPEVFDTAIVLLALAPEKQAGIDRSNSSSPKFSGDATGPRWRLACHHAPTRRRELRPTSFNNRLGNAGFAGNP